MAEDLMAWAESQSVNMLFELSAPIKFFLTAGPDIANKTGGSLTSVEGVCLAKFRHTATNYDALIVAFEQACRRTERSIAFKRSGGQSDWEARKESAYQVLRHKADNLFWAWLESQPAEFQEFMRVGFHRNKFPMVLVTPDKRLHLRLEALSAELGLSTEALERYIYAIDSSENFWDEILKPYFWLADVYDVRRCDPSTAKAFFSYRDKWRTRELQEYISEVFEQGHISEEDFRLIVKNYSEGFFKNAPPTTATASSAVHQSAALA